MVAPDDPTPTEEPLTVAYDAAGNGLWEMPMRVGAFAIDHQRRRLFGAVGGSTLRLPPTALCAVQLP